jgi:cytochrome c
MMKHLMVGAVAAVLACSGAATAQSKSGGKKGTAQAGNVENGKEVFEQCSVCHAVDTDEKKVGPSLKGLYKKPKMTNGKPVNDANVKAIINAGGNGMPAYEDMLTDEERTDLIAYLKTV